MKTKKQWAADAITRIKKLANSDRFIADQANVVPQKASRPLKKSVTGGVHVPSTDWKIQKVDPATADDAQPMNDNDEERLQLEDRGAAFVQVVKGGPGSGFGDIETEKMDMPKSPYISVGTRKGVLDNMEYTNEKIPLDKITHVAQEKFVPAKVDKMLLNYGKVRKMPIDVLKCGDEYHVIDGHHRFLAAQKNEEPSINARVRVKAMSTKSASQSIGSKIMSLIQKGGPGSGPEKGGETPAPAQAHAQHNPKSSGHGGHESQNSSHGGGGLLSGFDPYAVAAGTANKSAILKTDAAKQIVYGVVLTPEELDSQLEYMTADEIERTAHLYMEKSRVVGKNHSDLVKAIPVESYIAPFDFTMDGGQYGSQFVKKGAWVLAVKIVDPKEWQKVEDGEYTGFSIGGFGHRIPGQP